MTTLSTDFHAQVQLSLLRYFRFMVLREQPDIAFGYAEEAVNSARKIEKADDRNYAMDSIRKTINNDPRAEELLARCDSVA